MHPAKHLARFNGFLQADGYAGFNALYDPTADPARPASARITEVACWAHCRRKFFDWAGKVVGISTDQAEAHAAAAREFIIGSW